MKKLAGIFVLLMLTAALFGCSVKPIVFNTEVGTFTVQKLKFAKEYGNATPKSGEEFLLVYIVPGEETAPEQDLSFFMNGGAANQPATVSSKDSEVKCTSVSYELNAEKGETRGSALVFEVPASFEKSELTFTPPGQDSVALKK